MRQKSSALPSGSLCGLYLARFSPRKGHSWSPTVCGSPQSFKGKRGTVLGADGGLNRNGLNRALFPLEIELYSCLLSDRGCKPADPLQSPRHGKSRKCDFGTPKMDFCGAPSRSDCNNPPGYLIPPLLSRLLNFMLKSREPPPTP